MGFLTSSNPPILLQLPLLPSGYRWKFIPVGTKLIGAPNLKVAIQKKGRIFWSTIAYQLTLAATTADVVKAGHEVFRAVEGELPWA